MSCDGGGSSADITFEIALPADAESCGQDVREGVESLRVAPCASIRLFEQTESGRLEPIRLYDPAGDHEGIGSLERRVLLDLGRRIGFDARLMDPSRPHTLVFRIYDSDLEPVYGATLENQRFTGQGDRLRVRLYRFREWACPGRDAPSGAVARALHQAVPLPNGDVLILGGVRGDGIRAESITNPTTLPGAPLERSILLYDESEHQFVMLGGEQLGRVGFAARYDREEDGRAVIQVIGGYEMPADAASSPAILFDNTAGRFGPFGAPYVSSFRAVRSDSLELLVDLETLEVSSRELLLTGAPRGAFNVVSEMIEVSNAAGDRVGAAAVLVGFTRQYNGEIELPVSSTFFFMQEQSGNTAASMLTNGRLGGTVTALPERGAFLIWGGSVNDAGAPTITGAAGELVFLDGAPQPISSGGSVPPPLAFHTATRFPTDDNVVVAGGYEVRADGFIGAAPVPQRIFALRVEGASVTPREIVTCADETCPYTSTILHTATVVPGLGLVLTGGARTADAFDASRARRFDPVSQVGVVTSALAYRPFGADLTTPRFGHTATLLSGNRLLVVGGLTLDARTAEQPNDLRSVPESEIIYLDPRPSRLTDGTCEDTDLIPDGGVDGGVDAGPPPRDAGPPPPDAGPPLSDAGPLPDAGPVPDSGPDAGV